MDSDRFDMKFLVTLLLIHLTSAAVVQPLAVQPLAECEEVITGDGGIFTSPNFPEDYSSNANCSWIIITGASTAITLRFDTFLVESNDNVKVGTLIRLVIYRLT